MREAAACGRAAISLRFGVAPDISAAYPFAGRHGELPYYSELALISSCPTPRMPSAMPLLRRPDGTVSQMIIRDDWTDGFSYGPPFDVMLAGCSRLRRCKQGLVCIGDFS